jgi:hypothetical protein
LGSGRRQLGQGRGHKWVVRVQANTSQQVHAW